MYEKINVFYHFQISLFVAEIFEFLKYANCPNCNVIHSTKFLSIDKSKISRPNCMRNVMFFAVTFFKMCSAI